MEKSTVNSVLLGDDSDEESQYSRIGEKRIVGKLFWRRRSIYARLSERRSIVIIMALLCIVPLLRMHYRAQKSGTNPPIAMSDSSVESDCEPSEFACKVEEARMDFKELLQKQSKSADEAIFEYRRRYSREPPQGFDHWLELAFASNAKLIDEYDRIELDMEPFRSANLGQERLQRRMQAAVDANRLAGIEEKMLGYIHVSNGTATYGGVQEGFLGYGVLEQLLKPISSSLPNLTILKNFFTEPRVLLTSNALQNAQQEDHVYFQDYSEISTWDPLAESCNSQQEKSFRAKLGRSAVDTDICRYDAATLRQHHGFFVAPSHFYPTSSLIPLLSNAKISTMSDILVPNVCYASEKYRQFQDPDTTPYHKKKKSLYWRGATTGMYHSKNNWMQGHRERFVWMLQQLRSTIKMLKHGTTREVEKYEHVRESFGDDMTRLLRQLPEDAINVAFSSALGCDSEICNKMKASLHFTNLENTSEEKSYQLLGDVDGQGMSCRFYRHLSSNGLPLKHTIYQEWHDERIMPWLHFIPLSIHMDELPALLVWLLETEEGRAAAEEIAQAGRIWAEQALRPIDITLYYYRVLLEYASLFQPEQN